MWFEFLDQSKALPRKSSLKALPSFTYEKKTSSPSSWTPSQKQLPTGFQVLYQCSSTLGYHSTTDPQNTSPLPPRMLACDFVKPCDDNRLDTKLCPYRTIDTSTMLSMDLFQKLSRPTVNWRSIRKTYLHFLTLSPHRTRLMCPNDDKNEKLKGLRRHLHLLFNRAVHLEPVETPSKEACLSILQRFCAGRGLPQAIYNETLRTFTWNHTELNYKEC